MVFQWWTKALSKYFAPAILISVPTHWTLRASSLLTRAGTGSRARQPDIIDFRSCESFFVSFLTSSRLVTSGLSSSCRHSIRPYTASIMASTLIFGCVSGISPLVFISWTNFVLHSDLWIIRHICYFCACVSLCIYIPLQNIALVQKKDRIQQWWVQVNPIPVFVMDL